MNLNKADFEQLKNIEIFKRNFRDGIRASEQVSLVFPFLVSIKSGIVHIKYLLKDVNLPQELKQKQDQFMQRVEMARAGILEIMEIYQNTPDMSVDGAYNSVVEYLKNTEALSGLMGGVRQYYFVFDTLSEHLIIQNGFKFDYGKPYAESFALNTLKFKN